MEKKQKITAQLICEKAGSLVSGDRAKQHGDMAKTFECIAGLWSAYLRHCEDPINLSNEDVCNMNELQKIGRRLGGDHNIDDYIDGAGYAGISGELAEKNDVLLND